MTNEWTDGRRVLYSHSLIQQCITFPPLDLLYSCPFIVLYMLSNNKKKKKKKKKREK